MKAFARHGLYLALILSALAGCAQSELDSGPVDPREERAIAAVRLDPRAALAALDAHRASQGLGPVRLDAELTGLAQRQVDAMAAKGELSHDVAGAFSARLADSRIEAGEAGENLGAGYYTLDEAMAGWKGSSEHNANMLRRGFTRMGVAIAKNPRSHWGVFWAMEFAGEPARTADAGPTTQAGGAPEVTR